ncbi:alpha/beta hydrolase [Aquimarina brevivitae]|uniref:Serine aminopeptidase S33 domain-containing protein n=1 Tax=Aquimarina brevivitae TaxID=323412 RepID=A0A4Q7P1R6_9FLAO|nr:alpha/beta hydrolase [Aquimarina brevivitae]RZS93664.1 hypothetical protein EV197_2244 [Aquimarina brevivitae]
MRKFLKVLLLLGIFYTITILILYFFQEQILFQPDELSEDYTYQFNEPFKELFLEAKDGLCLNALHFKTKNPKGVILYFHGNRGNLKRWGSIVLFFVKKEYDVIVMDYRGYGKNEGDITEKSLYSDAQSFYDYTLTQYSEDQIILYGRSIGTGIAVKTAANNCPRNLVLETPYYDIKDIVESWLPHIPVNLLLKYKIPSGRFIKNVSCSVTIYHGTNDLVVPYKSAKKLYQKIESSKKQFITIPEGSHNNLVEFEAYLNTIESVLENQYTVIAKTP